MVVQSPEVALATYEKLIQPARERFAASRGIRTMISPDIDARRMSAFLLHFSALSIPITEPVEGWIRRAGERCDALGMTELGRALKAHSKAEAGHHQYHADDFDHLIAFWNARWSSPVRPDGIRVHRITSGGERYCQLHEDTIAGPTPYCQFAIEYEIELLPVEFGGRFVENCVRLLGREILECMSFVSSHIEFDVGHTKFNAHFLGKLIADHPDFLEPLAEAGAVVLDAYGQHLTDCMVMGEAFGERR